jgi:hypothetical protein
MTVNISKVTTGTAVGYQAAENDTATETNIDDTLLTVNVNTIAGMQDVSKQAILRGANIEDVVLSDLDLVHITQNLIYGILKRLGLMRRTDGSSLQRFNGGSNLHRRESYSRRALPEDRRRYPARTVGGFCRP